MLELQTLIHTDADDAASTVAAYAAMGMVSPRRVVPAGAYPMRLEEEYAGRILDIATATHNQLAPLLEVMPGLLARSRLSLDSANRVDAGEPKFARALVEQARTRVRQGITREQHEQLAAYYGGRTSAVQRATLARQLKAGLGIDIPISDRRTPEILEYFTNENAELITSIPEQYLSDVASLTARAFTNRMSPDTFAAELLARYDITENRARFIARDQIGKLHGQLAAYRQSSLGITHYFWIDRRDNRVRPAHRARHGKRFAYAKPPKGGHPGEDFGCRCVNRPDLSAVIERINAMRPPRQPTIRARR